MKKDFLLLIFFFLFCSFNLYSQDTTTVFLNEVVVQNKKIDLEKIKTIKTNGKRNGFFSMPEGVALVSKINEGKSGVLKSVTFFFSNRKCLNPKDTEFELLLFSENEEGLPGELLGHTKMKFKVLANHNGQISVDLSSQNLFFESPFFVGVKRLDTDTKWNFYIDVRHKENGTLYFKLPSEYDWKESRGKKLDVKIQYLRD